MMGIEGVVALIIGAALGVFIMTLISKNRLQQLKQMQQEEINGFLNQQIELNKALAISNEKSDNLANRMDQLDRQLEKERELKHEAEKY